VDGITSAKPIVFTGELAMPIVQIHLLEGRDVNKKRELVKNITQAVVDTLGSPPEKVRVILSDMKHHDYSVGGVLHCDQ
jgi:4-oxalocrotonate tautomerase